MFEFTSITAASGKNKEAMHKHERGLRICSGFVSSFYSFIFSAEVSQLTNRETHDFIWFSWYQIDYSSAGIFMSSSCMGVQKDLSL
jgi:hypothetical protein